jgi:hypothetical protein
MMTTPSGVVPAVVLMIIQIALAIRTAPVTLVVVAVTATLAVAVIGKGDFFRYTGLQPQFHMRDCCCESRSTD